MFFLFLLPFWANKILCVCDGAEEWETSRRNCSQWLTRSSNYSARRRRWHAALPLRTSKLRKPRPSMTFDDLWPCSLPVA